MGLGRGLGLDLVVLDQRVGEQLLAHRLQLCGVLDVELDQAANVRVGRLIELDVEDPGQLQAMCEKLLANPLIEDYEIQTEPAAEPASEPR